MRKVLEAVVVLVFGVLAGCASVRETYYLATYDPATDTRNYFRINIAGYSSLSKIKFSVGFYDKQAVERLFGEQVLQREHLGTEVDVFDHETGKRLADVGEQLTRARAESQTSKLERLRAANATVAGLLFKYDVRLKQAGKLDDFKVYLERIAQAHELASELLAKAEPTDGDLANAPNSVAEALVGLHAIRVAADGDVIVRFFDGAGNEIDVSSTAQVIFVANDVSRFAEAIRQLAEESQIQETVIDIVLGQRKADAERAMAEAAVSQEQAALASEALEELLTRTPSDADQLRAMVLDAAATLADGPSQFRTSDEIRDYLEGREP